MKIFGGHALQTLGKRGKRLFSYILHRKHDCIEHKRQDVLLNLNQECSLWQVTVKKQKKNSYSITAIQRINEIRNESSHL